MSTLCTLSSNLNQKKKNSLLSPFADFFLFAFLPTVFRLLKPPPQFLYILFHSPLFFSPLPPRFFTTSSLTAIFCCGRFCFLILFLFISISSRVGDEQTVSIRKRTKLIKTPTTNTNKHTTTNNNNNNMSVWGVDNTARRVKVFICRDNGNWEDQGTGYLFFWLFGGLFVLFCFVLFFFFFFFPILSFFSLLF